MADKNAGEVRNTIRDFIHRRKAGKVVCDLTSGNDVMSLMLKATEEFGEEDIIDEVVDLMVAGT